MKEGAEVLPAQHPKPPRQQAQAESAEQGTGKGSFPEEKQAGAVEKAPQSCCGRWECAANSSHPGKPNLEPGF